TTTDYLPVVGPVPNRAAFNACYASLKAKKTRFIDEECPTMPGLFILAGLGSRGLTAGPLAAEILVSDIMGEPSPVPRYLQQALAPARFLKRGIIRGRPL
ncbi:MAG: bifunctional tRNA (5-methylaminomethyl-2-thiouridine)(34)-methyltransferase MnmD/FAD-dependent 5-carboxymethylaminomethyl-2-thiouridine(34) oxidoreductase MnmC, partial [Luminiphilus sp.]|nr:bifunctional tRNA (5-methylaminomethyl-2-thiouridine)(34)-methyltransferase MnmD/FAD-dependent 5-carboxymethylaminomethyl-2-thiouridine(34) oxidoreductase MnmC [Luminiphilus sp.]